MADTATFPSLISQIDNGIRRFGADPLTALKSFDFKTVGLVGVSILLAVLIVDLLGYLYAAYKGTNKSYVPYSQSLALKAADAWENRESNAIGEFYDPYARARSLEPLTDVLDALSEGVRKWAGPQDDPNFSRTIPQDRSFVFNN